LSISLKGKANGEFVPML